MPHLLREIFQVLTLLDPDAGVTVAERMEGNLAKPRLLQGGNEDAPHHAIMLRNASLRRGKYEVARGRGGSGVSIPSMRGRVRPVSL